MKKFLILILSISIIFLATSVSCADELTDFLDQIEKLNISIQEYTLGKALTNVQKTRAAANIVKDSDPAKKTAKGTYKFKHENLNIVADKQTHRVIIIYEQHDRQSPQKMQEIVGNLFFAFGDPTVMAHDKIIYWAYGNKGKISQEKFRTIKESKKTINILATIKLNSSKKIMDLKNNDDKNPGSIYYIISSDPVLKLVNSKQ